MGFVLNRMEPDLIDNCTVKCRWLWIVYSISWSGVFIASSEKKSGMMQVVLTGLQVADCNYSTKVRSFDDNL